MAHGTPTILSSGSGLTGFFSPVAGSPFYVGVGIYDSDGAAAKASPSDGLSTVYTEIGDVEEAGARLTLYKADGDGNSRQVAWNGSGQEGRRMVAFQVVDGQIRSVSGSPQIVTGGGASGDASTAFANAPASASTVVAITYATAGTGSITSDADYTEIHDSGSGGDNSRIEVQYKSGFADATVSATSSNAGNAVIIAIEIEDFVAGQPFAKRLGGIPGMALNRGVW